jgi:single-stranded-DNA-specific exonuclease
LTIRADRIDQFRDEFVKVVDETLPLALRRPHATVDAVASPSEITLSLAEELEMFEPVGEGNPEVSLGVRSATLERPSRMGDGKHARFSVVVGDSSAEGVAFNARERISVQWGQACDVVGVLEVNRWKGREEPRFRVTRAAHSELKPIELVVGEDAWVERAFRDINQDPDTGSHALLRSNRRESVTMRSGISTLTRLCSGGQSVLAIVADVPRRLPGLQRVVGGFTLCDWSTFERSPELAERFEDVVLLDPPARPSLLELARSAGEGWLHRAWGGAEVRFALKVHENDTDIERQLRPFFKDLRAAAELGTADERLAAIQGPGRHPRSSVAVGWMLAVLREIGVAEVNQDGIEITLGDVRGELDTSVSWRRVNSRLEEGRSFLLSLMQVS